MIDAGLFFISASLNARSVVIHASGLTEKDTWLEQPQKGTSAPMKNKLRKKKGKEKGGPASAGPPQYCLIWKEPA
jgi:hypothetical protein